MSKIALSIGPIQIYWYSVIILIAIFVAASIVYYEMKKQGVTGDDFTDLFFNTVLFGIIGARIYYVLFNLSYYLENPIEMFEIWNGGLAIHGALIAGIIYVYLFCRKKKLNTLKILDMIVVGVIIGQSIGRWGNFFNQEAYGPVTTLAYLEQEMIPQFIINGMKILGEYHIPTFYYESLWNINGFIILLLVRNCKKIKNGQLTGIYLIWYSLGRFYVESLRMDSLMLKNFKMALLVSVVLLIIGLFLLLKDKILKKDTPNLYHDINTTKIGGDDEYNTL